MLVKRYSYHDSCWRSDGVESVVREKAQEISDYIRNQIEVMKETIKTKEDLKNIPDLDVNIRTEFNSWKKINISHGKVTDIDNKDGLATIMEM